MTFRTRTVRSSAMVSTSPILIACPGDFSRAPLTRTWPDSTSSAAEVRAFTTRACHSHLSMRCRSVVGSLLATGQLLLQRGELGEGRVGINRTIALARVGARGVGTQRRTALAIAATLVAVAATIVAALVAIAAELLVVAVAILVVAILALISALEAAVPVVPPLGTRRAFGATLARLVEVPSTIPAMTAAAAMPLLAALLAVGGLRGFAFSGHGACFDSSLRTRLIVVALVAMTLVTRLAIVVTAAGTPD